MSITIENLKAFEEKNKESFQKIKESLDEFNIFNVLKVQYREIRHSNFLGWLFDPNESHKMGTVFLESLLKTINEKHNAILNDDSYQGLFKDDLKWTKVYRETKHNIDILIVNDRLNFVICIENKIHAGYSENQLEKYYNYVEKNYPYPYKRIYLTLTPFKSGAHNGFAKGEEYSNINYQSIVQIINANKDIYEAKEGPIKESIKQYITMVEKSITQTNEEVKLAQKIYKEYFTEINFIIDNKINFNKQRSKIDGFILGGELGDFEIINSDYHKDIIRILPKDETILKLFKDPNFKSWGGEYFFTLELFFQKGHIWLKPCFGNVNPEKEELKAELQTKKDKMVEVMNGFDVIKKPSNKLKIDIHGSSSADDFTGICGINLFYFDTFLKHGDTFEEFFKNKFALVNEEFIQPWIEECKLKY
jgi:hypothetical protein